MFEIIQCLSDFELTYKSIFFFFFKLQNSNFVTNIYYYV